MNRIITLTTDFGTRDSFVGAMKGVILSINPEATLVDISHDIAPQNIEQGALVFASAAKYFPPNAIHLVVVDPGVGSARRAIAAQAGEAFFVAPDNGVLSLALPPREFRAVHLNKPEFWLPHISNTFHGRDIFAPVAAHLSLGVPLSSFGEPVEQCITLLALAATRQADGTLIGRVIHIDRFGNLLTNISAEMLQGKNAARLAVQIAGRELIGLHRVYADGARGEVIALIGSAGLVEIAVREASAAQVLDVGVGMPVVVSDGF